MEVPQQPTAIRWYWWMLATAGSLTVAIAAVATLLYVSPIERVFSAVLTMYPAALFTYHVLSFTLTGIVIGLAVGLGQWLVLRKRFGRIAAWILVTALGLGLGNAIGNLAVAYMTRDCWPSFFPAYCFDVFWNLQVRCIGGALCGALIGIAQWIILRRQVRYAGWWIPTNILTWSAGSTAWLLVDWAITTPFWNFFYNSPLIDLPPVLVSGRFLLGIPLFAVVVGTITGVVLPRLPMQPYYNRSKTVAYGEQR